MKLALAILAWALGLALLPIIAFATEGDPAFFSYGGNFTQSWVRLARLDNGDLTVTFQNHLNYPQFDVIETTLHVPGADVLVMIDEQDGRQPERIEVVPPPGFEADPAFLLVDDDSQGMILLRPIPLG